MLPNEIQIPAIGLLAKVKELDDNGYRFVTASCVQTDTGFDIIYHFDKDFELYNVRISIAPDEEVTSISGIYFCALLVENEIQDLFGIKFAGLALDLGGHMYLVEDAEPAPFAKPFPAAEEKGGE